MRIKHIAVVALVCSVVSCEAQKQNFDVVSFVVPSGWDKTEFSNGIQLSTKDDGNGNYAAAVITRSRQSTLLPVDNFKNTWVDIVKGTVSVSEDPLMDEPYNQNGWTCIAGRAHYTDGKVKGGVTLITATGSGKTVSLILLTNTDKYGDVLKTFVNSLSLTAIPEKKQNGKNSPTSSTIGNSDVIGLWTSNIPETNGYSNGMPQYSGGYLRSEYLLRENGTYVYRVKNWLVYGAKDILFLYETGTYSVNGNQIIISPKASKGGWWKKAASTKDWGPFVKSSANTSPERKIYSFEIKDNAGTDNTTLVFKTGNITGVQEYSYKRQNIGESRIDNPPAFTAN